MKKIINLMLLAVIMAAVTACGQKDAMLKAQIESGQKHCPMSLGMAGKLTSMSYDDATRMVKFVLTLNKDFADVKDFQQDPGLAQESMKLSLSKGDMKKLLDMMVEAESGLEVIYKNRGGNDEFVLKFSAEELKQIADNPMSEEDTNKLLLANQIKAERQRMPYTIDTGLKVTGIEDSGKALVYICEVNENDYDINEMEASSAELKENMRPLLNDISMKAQVKLLTGLDKGFEYRYVGDKSGKAVIVSFTPEELKALSSEK